MVIGKLFNRLIRFAQYNSCSHTSGRYTLISGFFKRTKLYFHASFRSFLMMPLPLKPTLLTDKSRLKEIYQLRVLAWENSENSRFVKSRIFPDGWKDDFDDSATHWIIEADNRIIASARVYVANVKDNVMANRYETIVPCAFL